MSPRGLRRFSEIWMVSGRLDAEEPSRSFGHFPPPKKPRRSYMLFYASMRSVYTTVEQPQGSLFYHMSNIKAASKTIGASTCSIWLGGWGHSTPKPTAWQTTFPSWAVGQL
eukprot:4135667-Pyramimonas_sp.AAC.1